jgi:hypothetical protein
MGPFTEEQEQRLKEVCDLICGALAEIEYRTMAARHILLESHITDPDHLEQVTRAFEDEGIIDGLKAKQPLRVLIRKILSGEEIDVDDKPKDSTGGAVV